MKAAALRVGGRYNWKGQAERLIYLGNNWSGNGRWHQFAKVEAANKVWCEVQQGDLESFEVTVGGTCQGCGSTAEERARSGKDYTGLSDCPQCGAQKCCMCDMGDDVECGSCDSGGADV